MEKLFLYLAVTCKLITENWKYLLLYYAFIFFRRNRERNPFLECTENATLSLNVQHQRTQTFPWMYNIRERNPFLECTTSENATLSLNVQHQKASKNQKRNTMKSKINTIKFVNFSGKTIKSHVVNIRAQVISTFKGHFNKIVKTQIQNYLM